MPLTSKEWQEGSRRDHVFITTLQSIHPCSLQLWSNLMSRESVVKNCNTQLGHSVVLCLNMKAKQGSGILQQKKQLSLVSRLFGLSGFFWSTFRLLVDCVSLMMALVRHCMQHCTLLQFKHLGSKVHSLLDHWLNALQDAPKMRMWTQTPLWVTLQHTQSAFGFFVENEREVTSNLFWILIAWTDHALMWSHWWSCDALFECDTLCNKSLSSKKKSAQSLQMKYLFVFCGFEILGF